MIYKYRLIHSNLYADVNECSVMTLNDCDINATCADTIGGFFCACDIGYTGNGTYCEGSMMRS